MNAEIIAVGTELLMGQIVNTNAQFLSQRFAEMGVNVFYQTVVGDNAARMRDAMTLAASRADLVVMTGGLGPTQDDLTKEVLAGIVGRKLVVHKPSMERIEAYYQKRGLPMAESNRRQALLIEDAEPLLNDTGMAVGLALTWEGTHYVLLPGPPKELIPMFDQYARPWITKRLDDARPIYSRLLKFAGIGESALEERIKDLIDSQTDPTLAPYASEGQVTIRLTTRAANVQEAEDRFVPLIMEIARRLGDYFYADGDIGLEEAVVELMSARKLTLAVAESCTGGLLGQMITSVPGSSAVFMGGVISYSNTWKSQMLDVPEDWLEGMDAPGAVSAEVAIRMAERVRELQDTDFGAAITGVAGPSSSERKPVGLVYIAIAAKEEKTYVAELNLHGNRELIRLRAARHVLYQLWRRVVR